MSDLQPELIEVARFLQQDAAGLPSTEHWNQSQACYPGEDAPLIDPVLIREAADKLELPQEAVAALDKARHLLERHTPLRRWAWHCQYWLVREPGNLSQEVLSWPMLPSAPGDGSALFYGLIFLSGIPDLLRRHGQRKIPETVTWETLSDIRIWMEEYRRKHGEWGFDKQRWMAHHFAGQLYRLGRLQFEFRPYPFDFHAFRHRESRKVVMLAGDGMAFREDGQFDGTNGIHGGRKKLWTTSFRTDRYSIAGTPLSADGMVLRRMVALDATEWMPALKKGDPTLNIHIPAEGPMSPEACGESVAAAMAFFRQYFPEYAYRAIATSTWLLDRQFNELLPESSNIRRFLREFYLHPVPIASERQAYERVFGTSAPDLLTLKPSSSLQKVMLEHVKNGGRFYHGGGVIFPEDLPWGQQVYQQGIRGLKLPGQRLR